MKKIVISTIAAATMLSGAAYASDQHVNGSAGDSVIVVNNIDSEGNHGAGTLYYSLDYFVAATTQMSAQISTLNSQLATSQGHAQYLANQRNAVVNADLYGIGVDFDADDYNINEMSANGMRGDDELTDRQVTTGGWITGQGEALGAGLVLDEMTYQLTINGQVRRGGHVDVYVIGDPTKTAVNILNELGQTFDHGYELGFSDGWADGFDAGYEQGYEEGYAEGFADGVEKGIDIAMEVMENAN